MNAPASKLQEQQEPDIFDKTIWLCAEVLLLSHLFEEAATKLEASRSHQSVAGMRSAYLDLAKFIDQAVLLNDSLQRAIENHGGRS